jgi:hypothetical protein
VGLDPQTTEDDAALGAPTSSLIFEERLYAH